MTIPFFEYAIPRLILHAALCLFCKQDIAQGAAPQNFATQRKARRIPGTHTHEREFSPQNNSLSSYLIRAVFPFAVSMIV